MATSDGTSLFGHVHAMNMLVGSAGEVLMQGGGGLAITLTRKGARVTVVGMDPVAHEITLSYFSLHPEVDGKTEDALIFVRRCTGRYDGVIIDVCDEFGIIPPVFDPDLIEVIARTRLEPAGWRIGDQHRPCRSFGRQFLRP